MGLFTFKCPMCIKIIGPSQDELQPGNTYTFRCEAYLSDWANTYPPPSTCSRVLSRSVEVRLSYISSKAKKNIDYIGPTSVTLPQGGTSASFRVDILENDDIEKVFQIRATSTDSFYGMCAGANFWRGSIAGGDPVVVPPAPPPAIPPVVVVDPPPPPETCYDYFTNEDKTWTKCSV